MEVGKSGSLNTATDLGEDLNATNTERDGENIRMRRW